MDGGDNQIADENLENLSLQAGAAGEDLLKDADEDVTQGRGDKHAVQGHLRDARAEIVTVLADIMSEPRGEQFLQTREHTRGEHLGAQRVVLQLLEVGRKVSRLSLSTGQSLADAVSKILGLTASIGDRANSLLLEFDRHGVLDGSGERNQEVNGGSPNTSKKKKRITNGLVNKEGTQRGSIVELSSGGELFVYEKVGGGPRGGLGWGGNT